MSRWTEGKHAHVPSVPPARTSHVPPRTESLRAAMSGTATAFSWETAWLAMHLARQVHASTLDTCYWQVPGCRILIFPKGHMGKGTLRFT